MREPDNVVTATVLLDIISVVDLEATGGSMCGRLMLYAIAVFDHACGMVHDNGPGKVPFMHVGQNIWANMLCSCQCMSTHVG